MNTIDSLLSLANFDIDKSEETEFLTFMRDFSLLWQKNEFSSVPIDATQRHRLYMEGLPELSDKGILHKRRQYFSKLQSHLVKLLLGENAGQREGEPPKPLVEMAGQLILCIDPETGEYVEKFQISKNVSTSDKLNQRDDKLLLDLSFVGIIKQHKIKADRIKRCQTCKKIFYQQTAKPKMFCSSYCGGVVRQARYEPTRKKKLAQL